MIDIAVDALVAHIFGVNKANGIEPSRHVHGVGRYGCVSCIDKRMSSLVCVL